MVEVKVKRLQARATMPTFGTEGAACFDLYACLDEGVDVVTSWGSQVVNTGLAMEIPEGHVLMLFSRSGQAFKDNTRLANCVGIIDSDYRGPVKVKLTRDDDIKLTVRHGDRVAQGMVIPRPEVKFIESELSDTARGEGAFGSTGA